MYMATCIGTYTNQHFFSKGVIITRDEMREYYICNVETWKCRKTSLLLYQS